MQNFTHLWKNNRAMRQVSIVSLFLIVLAVPFTVYLSGQQQNTKQDAFVADTCPSGNVACICASCKVGNGACVTNKASWFDRSTGADPWATCNASEVLVAPAEPATSCGANSSITISFKDTVYGAKEYLVEVDNKADARTPTICDNPGNLSGSDSCTSIPGGNASGTTLTTTFDPHLNATYDVHIIPVSVNDVKGVDTSLTVNAAACNGLTPTTPSEQTITISGHAYCVVKDSNPVEKRDVANMPIRLGSPSYTILATTNASGMWSKTLLPSVIYGQALRPFGTSPGLPIEYKDASSALTTATSGISCPDSNIEGITFNNNFSSLKENAGCLRPSIALDQINFNVGYCPANITPTTPPITAHSPNCSLTGPTTVVKGVPATFTGSFYSPEGLLAGVIQSYYPDHRQNGDILFQPWESRGTNGQYRTYPKDLGGADGTPTSASHTFTWTPPADLAPGVYPVFCRAWNDSREECTGNIDTIKAPYTPSVCTGTGQGITAGPTKLMVTVRELSSSDTLLNFSLLLHGLGKGGDALSATASGNQNPLDKTRDFKLEAYTTAGQLVWDRTFENSLLYQTTGANAGKFTAAVTVTDLPVGNYIFKVRTNNYLKRQIPQSGFLTISQTSDNTYSDIPLVVGDSNMDNKLDINDYQIFYNCYSDGAPARSCTASQKVSADYNDDGQVTLADLNIFTRELSVREGN